LSPGPPEQTPASPVPASTVFTLNIRASDSARVNVAQTGDQYNYIYRGRPPYQVEPFDLAAGLLPPAGPGRIPSRLLAARYRVVPFFPRPELGVLESWREGASPDFSVRLLHAEGGAGKTRLAAQFALSSSQARWTVATARHRSEVAAAGGPDRSLTVQAPGLVMIIDYADRWPLEDLMTLVRQHRDAARDRLRILLLGRPAGPWWQGVAHQLGKLDIFDTGALPLRDLPGDPGARTSMYRLARDSFARIFGLNEPTRIPVPDGLTGQPFALPLTIHMRALADADAVARGQEPPAGNGQAQLSSYLLDRERDYWHSAHDHGRGPVGTAPRTLGRTVYLATLTGTTEPRAALAALTRTGVVADQQAGGLVLADHARCYPPEIPGWTLEPLRPDRLGEDFLALTLPGREDELGYYATDPWAGTAAARLLASEGAPDGSPPHVRAAMTTLIEAAHRWPHVTTGILAPLLRAHPTLALDAGGAALSRLAGLTSLDIEVLGEIEKWLPEISDVDLGIGIAALIQRLVSYRLTRDPTVATQARMHAVLGWRYGSAGLYSQALSSVSVAVSLCRRLASEDPGANLSDLARSLDNLGIVLANLGRRQEALESALEATSIRRTLVRADRTTHLPDLAVSLINLSTRYWNLNQPADGLAAGEEALGIWQQLAESDPTTYLPDLALAQHNVGNLLSDLGRHRRALVLAEESLVTCRQLAAASPAVYLPDLALALAGLSGLRAKQGQFAVALELAEEAEMIYRRLAEVNAAVFLPSLAMIVNNLGLLMKDLGRASDAFPLELEAVELYTKLADASPDTYLPDVAMSLHNIASTLAELGRHEESVPPALEAVTLYDELAEAHPDQYLRYLAATLLNTSNYLDELDRPDALSMLERAASIYAELSAKEHPAFPGELAAGLNTLGLDFAKLDRYPEALEFTARSISVLRGLDGHDLTSSPSVLARALLGFAFVREMAAVELDAALAATEESIGIYELLAERSPGVFSELLQTARSERDDLRDAIAHGQNSVRCPVAE